MDDDQMDVDDLTIVEQRDAEHKRARDLKKEQIRESLPWVEKYRPSKFDDLVAHDDIITTLRKLVKENKLPHLLLYGPPGTGKTSTILTIAKEINGPNYQQMVLELNASDDRNIRVVREEIKDFASTRKIFDSGIKLIILDEADALTNDAQAALRRIIEKYTKNTRFCLICNHVNKIIPAIQSRCTKFRFGPLPEPQVRIKLNEVIAKEKMNMDDTAIKAVIRLGSGDMRKNLNILQACSMAFPDQVITEEQVYQCTGTPSPNDIRTIVDWLLNESFEVAFEKINDMKINKGYALQDILTYVARFASTVSLDDATAIGLFKRLSDIEYRLASGSNDRIQTSALVGAFQIVREQVAEKHAAQTSGGNPDAMVIS